MTLTESQMQVARLLGITEAAANKLRDGITPKVSLLQSNLSKDGTHIYISLFIKNKFNCSLSRRG